MPRTRSRLARRDGHVLAAERHDPRPVDAVGQPATCRSACRPAQTTRRSTRLRRRVGARPRSATGPLDPGHRGRQQDLPAGRLDVAGERPSDADVVRDRRRRRVQRGQPGGVRLDLGDARGRRPGAARARRWRAPSPRARRTAPARPRRRRRRACRTRRTAARARRSTPCSSSRPRVHSSALRLPGL